MRRCDWFITPKKMHFGQCPTSTDRKQQKSPWPTLQVEAEIVEFNSKLPMQIRRFCDVQDILSVFAKRKKCQQSFSFSGYVHTISFLKASLKKNLRITIVLNNTVNPLLNHPFLLNPSLFIRHQEYKSQVTSYKYRLCSHSLKQSRRQYSFFSRSAKPACSFKQLHNKRPR